MRKQFGTKCGNNGTAPRGPVLWRVKPTDWWGRAPVPPFIDVYCLDPDVAYAETAVRYETAGCHMTDATIELRSGK